MYRVPFAPFLPSLASVGAPHTWALDARVSARVVRAKPSERAASFRVFNFHSRAFSVLFFFKLRLVSLGTGHFCARSGFSVSSGFKKLFEKEEKVLPLCVNSMRARRRRRVIVRSSTINRLHCFFFFFFFLSFFVSLSLSIYLCVCVKNSNVYVCYLVVSFFRQRSI